MHVYQKPQSQSPTAQKHTFQSTMSTLTIKELPVLISFTNTNLIYQDFSAMEIHMLVQIFLKHCECPYLQHPLRQCAPDSNNREIKLFLRSTLKLLIILKLCPLVLDAPPMGKDVQLPAHLHLLSSDLLSCDWSTGTRQCWESIRSASRV